MPNPGDIALGEDGSLIGIIGPDGKLYPIQQPPEPEFDIDLGEYCVDCRKDVSQKYGVEDGRIEGIFERIKRGETEPTRIKGFLCRDCKPLEGTLLEPIIEALAERRWDPIAVRKAIATVGAERFHAALTGPFLDHIELVLQLER